MLQISLKLVPAALLLCLATNILAAPRTPKVGSSERKAIMDALRKVVGKGERKPIVFVADHLKTERGYAYFAGYYKYADGTRAGNEFTGGNLSALLQRTGKKWRVLYDISAGDVIEPEIMKKFPRAPKAIFKREN